MDLNKLFAEKGRLTTEIEIKQDKLRQVNNAILKALTEENKETQEKVDKEPEPEENNG